MAVPNYDSQLVDALWALLEASQDVTGIVTKAGNRQKLSTRKGWLKDLFTQGREADYPLIKIDIGDFAAGAFTQDPTFATETTAFNASAARWPMARETEILIVLVTRELSLADQNELEAAVEKTLLKSGPHLGRDEVLAWTYRGRRQITNKDEAKGTLRRKTTLRLRVQQEFQGADFIA